jgi:chitinase
MSKRDYILAGYVEGKALSDVKPEQARSLTHLNIAFGVVDSWGEISVDGIRPSLVYIKKLREANPSLRILLSTGGGGGEGTQLGSGSLSTHGGATRTPEGVARLVESCVNIVREYSLDGVDCDWEYPCSTGHRGEREQYTALL